MKLLFASDSFKGSLSSRDIASILEEEALRVFGEVHCHALPIADGGEGTVEAVLSALGGKLVHVNVEGPLGDPVKAFYGRLKDGRCVIEMAAASGITLVGRGALDPRRASTVGFGELIAHALESGAEDIYLALGGSATNDGGMGAMRALGVRFYDAKGCELYGRGEDLALVRAVDISAIHPCVRCARFTVMCDVTNPLVGPAGATAVFGPQKGATPEMLIELERGMENLAAVLKRDLGADVAHVPGAGAAGGLGAACLAFLDAELVSGIDCLMDLADFDALLADADLCISGEGRADAQSLDGKVLSGVARRCKRAGVPAVAIVGSAAPDADALLEIGISEIVPCVKEGTPIEDALAHARENYARAAAHVFENLAHGGREGHDDLGK